MNEKQDFLLLIKSFFFMTKVEKIIGIVISKENFDVAYVEKEKMKTRKFSYTESEMKKFIGSLPSGSLCVMESTGVYHLRLAHALHEAGIALSVVNPLSVKCFFRLRCIV
jgi:transposase